ncbi:MAG: MFS transporter [Euryarchaeota archaeon]|nr:MFS transporter [Euryarchaeota archaeon]MDE1837033.1 MFS transporter [Euryarchaeota archaeon]MDE1879883.1 MFS transporter [Euryarchaeota archaeon]MDE2045691.1 MFS transporter [Thermoplasmata archaeon]
MVAYKWTVLSNTTLGALLAALDGTIVLISLPVIFHGLGVDPFAPSSFPLLIWLLLGYGVVTGTLLVTMGRLSDMWGRARMYNFGFAIFSTGSIFLFLAPNSGTTGALELILFRLVQAVGASFLFANSAALLTDAFPPSERGKALGVNQVAFLGGSLFGLILGGILASIPDIHLGPIVIPTWRIIFLVSVPVGVFGTLWAYAKLREISVRTTHQRIDYVGNVTFAAGLVLLLVGTTYGLLPYGSSPTGWGNPWVWAGLVAGTALLLLFLYVETKVPDPMFRLEFFSRRSFAAGISSAFLGSVARGGMMLLLVLWFQGIWLPLHGYSFSQTPLWAGILMSPMMAGFVVAGPLSGWLSDRRGARSFATAGMALGSATFFALAFLPTNFPYWEMGLIIFLQGCGMGMFASPNAAAIMNSVPAENRGAASGMLATLQNIGQQASMALFFTIVILGLSHDLSGSVSGALAGNQVGPPDQQILTGMIAQNPTGALFGAFLGQNPMTGPNGVLHAASSVPGWQQLPASTVAALSAPHFFATAISAGFTSALSEAFLFAGGVTAVSAVISALRGGRYVYGEETPAPSLVQQEARPESREGLGLGGFFRDPSGWLRRFR